MAKASTKNAHIREDKSKRQAPEIKASDSTRLLNDPAFVEVFERLRNRALQQLEAITSDGSSESDAYEREWCRILRTLNWVKRDLVTVGQKEQLRLANQPRETE